MATTIRLRDGVLMIFFMPSNKNDILLFFSDYAPFRLKNCVFNNRVNVLQ